MRKYIYGAGFNCEACIKSLEAEDIVGIIDRDQSKWNSNIFDIPILSTEVITENEFDAIIVSVINYVDIVDYLINKDIEIDKIYVYNSKRNSVIPLRDIYEDYIEERIYRKKAVQQIKTGLLLEAYKNKEFQGINLISVFGEETDYELIKGFFDDFEREVRVVYRKMLTNKNVEKYVLCSSNYKNDLKNIKKNECGNKQWLILPFFDVKNSLDWK